MKTENQKKIAVVIAAILSASTVLAACGDEKKDKEDDLPVGHFVPYLETTQNSNEVIYVDSEGNEILPDFSGVAEETDGEDDTVGQRETLDADEVNYIIDHGMEAYNTYDYDAMYAYTDEYLSIVSAGSEANKDNFIAWGNQRGDAGTSNPRGFDYLVEFINQDTDNGNHYVNVINQLIEEGKIEGITPADVTIDGVWEGSGVADGRSGDIAGSLYVLHINGEWKLDTFFRSYVVQYYDDEAARQQAEEEKQDIPTKTLHTYDPNNKPREYFIDSEGNEW